MRAKLTEASSLATFEPSFAGFPTPRPTERVRQRSLCQLLLVLALNGGLDLTAHPLDHLAWVIVARIATTPWDASRPHAPKRTSTPGKSVTKVARGVPTAGRRRIVSADPSSKFGKSTAELPADVSRSNVSISSLMRAVAASATSWKRSGLLTRP